LLCSSESKAGGELYVIHLNDNKLDNRRANLRLITHAELMHRRGAYTRGGKVTSQYKGVRWDAQRRGWRPTLVVNGKRLRFGRYKTEEEAARAYDEAARLHYGELAVLNFPEEAA
jgi:hypothetical protein